MKSLIDFVMLTYDHTAGQVANDKCQSLPLPPFKNSLTVWLVIKPAHDFWAFN
jgi:hypothetical protein